MAADFSVVLDELDTTLTSIESVLDVDRLRREVARAREWGFGEEDLRWLPRREARDRVAAGRRTNAFRMLAAFPAMFLKNYFYYGACKDGIHGIVISILEEMRAAHHVYERHGFARVPERDWKAADGRPQRVYALELSGE